MSRNQQPSSVKNLRHYSKEIGQLWIQDKLIFIYHSNKCFIQEKSERRKIIILCKLIVIKEITILLSAVKLSNKRSHVGIILAALSQTNLRNGTHDYFLV